MGDSSFEIDGCVSDQALNAEHTDHEVLALLNKMTELYELKNVNESEMSAKEAYDIANKIAYYSIQIESIFKTKQPSYLTLQQVKEDSVKYRPSKNLLQYLLKKYFEEVLCLKDEHDKQDIKLLVFDSVLQSDQIISNILKKIPNLYPNLIIYNSYRNNLFLYSNQDKNDQYFDSIQNKILKDDPSASLIESNKNFRVLRCKIDLESTK